MDRKQQVPKQEKQQLKPCKRRTLKEWMTSAITSSTKDPSGSPNPLVLVLDGGTSTHLERTGSLPFSHNLWSSSLLMTEEGRNQISSCHDTFYSSGGCDIVTTVTYQCSHYVCHNIDDLSPFTELMVDELLGTGVNIAIDARRRIPASSSTKALVFTEQPRPESGAPADETSPDNGKYVAASAGCYGAALANGEEYTGYYGPYVGVHDLVEFHRRRFCLFMNHSVKRHYDSKGKLIEKDCVDGTNATMNEKFLSLNGDCNNANDNIDAVAFETIPSLMEVEAIVTLLTEEKELNYQKIIVEKDGKNHSLLPPSSPRPAVWISLACKNGSQLNDGSLITEALDKLKSMDPDCALVHGIGINCFAICHLQSLIHIILEHQIKFKTYRGILIYPNSGEEWDASQGNWVEGNGCADVTQFASEIMKGVRYVHDTCRKENAPLVPLVVGGCCRTSQETIRAIRCSLDSYIRC